MPFSGMGARIVRPLGFRPVALLVHAEENVVNIILNHLGSHPRGSVGQRLGGLADGQSRWRVNGQSLFSKFLDNAGNMLDANKASTIGQAHTLSRMA